MDITTAWKESTQKIFWGVIVIAAAGILSTIYDYVSYGVIIMEYVSDLLPRGFGYQLETFLYGIKTIGILSKLAVMAGYILYLMGLTRFTAIQSNNMAAQNIQKVRSAVVILIWCFAILTVFGVLLSFPLVGIVINIGVWIATLVAYFKMRNGFAVLKTSPAFSTASQKGANKLRFAAVCNIRLMLMPIVVALAIGLVALIAFAMLSKGPSKEALYVPAILGGLILISTVICAIIFMVFAFIYPFIGWYQIMNGGPGEDTVIDPAEIEQRLATIPTADDQMKVMKEKGEAALASAKESMANLQQDMAPKLEKAKSWAAANKKWLGIGAGAVVVVALLAWLIPKLGSDKPIEFELYSPEEEYNLSVDIPKGNSEREQNVVKGLREIISKSKFAQEVGAPVEGTLRDVLDDYHNRVNKYQDDFLRTSGAPYPPTCQLDINCIFQNEASASFMVDDGIYFNGFSDRYCRVIRFSDGHVMELSEMVNISNDKMEELIRKYQQYDLPVSLEEGCFVLPAANDSVEVFWTVSRAGLGDVLIPISDMEPYMTEAGKEIFMAKALPMPEKQQPEYTDESQEAENVEDSGDALDMEEEGFVGGLLGALPNGATKYVGDMAGFPIELTIHKDDGGLRADYLNVKYSAKMKLVGESLPADGGNITFFGQDAQGNQWFFDLEGDADNITGTGRGGGKNLPITLHRKN